MMHNNSLVLITSEQGLENNYQQLNHPVIQRDNYVLGVLHQLATFISARKLSATSCVTCLERFEQQEFLHLSPISTVQYEHRESEKYPLVYERILLFCRFVARNNNNNDVVQGEISLK